MAHRFGRAISQNPTLADVRNEFPALIRLVEPALKAARQARTLVIVPDENLTTIPFAAISNSDGTPLVSTHAVLYAPSLTTFLLASRRLTAFEPTGVTAIGQGHDPPNGL